MEINGTAQVSAQLDAIVSQSLSRALQQPSDAQPGGSSEAVSAEFQVASAPDVTAAAAILAQARSAGEEKNFLDANAEQVNQVASQLGINTNFQIKLSGAGDYYVEVRNRYDGSLIKTIPPEWLIRMRERMQEILKGLLVNNKS